MNSPSSYRFEQIQQFKTAHFLSLIIDRINIQQILKILEGKNITQKIAKKQDKKLAHYYTMFLEN